MPARRRLPVPAVAALAVLAALAVAVPPATATNDTHWDKQWGPMIVGAPQAWAATTGAGVIIGVVDSGIDLAHEDLAGKVAAATACIGTGGDPGRCASDPSAAQDRVGHGTHVAGVAAAAKDNGRGIAGIAPDARLAVARVFEGDSATIDDVNAGIRWVVDHGARVVNLSLGGAGGLLGGLLGGGGGSSLAPGIDYAWSRGAVTVLAAGNVNFLGLGSANYGTIDAVVVGATGRSDEPAGYSSPTGNAKWAVAAPGGNVARGGTTSAIYSSIVRTGAGNEYGYLEGTSMAAPHVSGALALLLSRPGMTNARAVEIVLGTANRSVRCGATCAGRLDVAAAVAATGAGPAPAPVLAPAPTAAPAAPATARAAPSTTTTTTTTAPATTAPLAPAPEAPTPTEPATEPAAESPAEPGREDQTATALAAGPGAGRSGDDDVAVPAALAAMVLVAAAAATATLGWRRRGLTGGGRR